MWWLNLLLPSVIGSMFLGKRLYENSRSLRLSREAMARCAVTDQKSSGIWAWRAKLTARSGPVEVRISDAGGDNERFKVVVTGPEGLSVLKLRRRILKSEIKVGDEKFDDAFFVDGPLRPVCARLDASMRGLLLRANADCNPLDIGGGKLAVEVHEDQLPRVLPLLLDIGRELARPVNVDRQIAENALQDPEARVRLVNLLLLARESPGDPQTLQVLRAACSDESPQVRLRAALELGDEGHETLLAVAESPQDDDIGARAVAHLGGRLPFERLRGILSGSLSSGLSRTARACLELLGQRRAEAVGVLERVMSEEKGELAAAAAAALGATGEEAAEAPLLQALQSEDDALREAAASALGRVGTVAAVPLLQEAAERSLFDLALRRNARQAIAEIQARLQDASPGQLSLAQEEAGQLSLTQEEAGQLSLAPFEAEAEPGLAPPPGARDTTGLR